LLLLNWSGVFKTILGIDTAILVTLLAGYKTFHNSISALLEKRISADIALCIAVIAALATGQYLAAAEAMFIVLVGEGLESYAAGRTTAAIEKFVEQMPRHACLVRDGQEEQIRAELLKSGDLIVVRSGERIPADGVIETGSSSIEESSVTGEPLPKEKQAGDEAFSGTLNASGLLQIRVTRAGDNTTLARVVQLVQEAQERRSPVERLADRYATFFLPALLVAAAATFLFTWDWLRTVSVLIVACPCALILATPTAMVAAMGGLARRGILVRGAAVLERAAQTDSIIFDKTGTITEGKFEIVRILPAGRSEQDVLALAAAAESASNHPLAAVIEAEAARRALLIPKVETAEVVPGRGATCIIQGAQVRAGSAQFLTDAGVQGLGPLAEAADESGATAVFVSSGSELAGAILLRDRLREGVREALQGLRNLGLSDHEILTGDRLRPSQVMARLAGIAKVTAELLPVEKAERVKGLIASGAKPAMIGEGLNDAPALANANVGIAVAGANDITAEAADAVYLSHSLASLPVFFETSRRAVRTAWQNIILFAGVLNAGAVALAATGTIGPVGAAVTHQLSSFFVMMNSLRLLRVRTRGRTGDYVRNVTRRAKPIIAEFVPKLEFDAIADWFLKSWPRLRKPLIYAAFGLYVGSGFYVVKPDENGIIERFGQKQLPYRDPGLHYKLPWPVERLTRIQPRRVRVVEIGFRTNTAAQQSEPVSYEWNSQHRAGRYQKIPEEALMLTGDQNMIELTAAIHYVPEHPDDFVFQQLDADATVRAAAESVVASVVTSSSLDEVLTLNRTNVQQRVQQVLQDRLNGYRAGVRVLHVMLEDVHPSIEVVDAFRQVSDAYEEKSRLINEAEGYRNEHLALARGNADALITNANAYSLGRTVRAEGDAGRFTARERAFQGAPQATESRLYLETIEDVLPGKKKLIVDKGKSRRNLFLLEDGVELPSGIRPLAEIRR
jgi:HflK protein